MSRCSDLLDVLYRIKDSIVALDNECTITYANQAYADMFGLITSQLIGKNVWILFPKVVGSVLYTKIMEAIATKEFQRFEWQGVYADKFWETTVFPSEKGITVLNKDITERKKAEELILQTKDEMNAVLENIDNGFLSLDNDWRFLYVNGRAAGNVGYKPQELIGKNIWEVFPKIIGTIAEVYYKRAMVEREIVTFNHHGVLTDRWYEEKVYPTSKGIAIFWVDITERKKSEEALLLSEVLKAQSSYARSLIEASLDPFVTINLDGKITDVNSATELITGYYREQLIGSDFSNYFTEPEKAERGYREVFTKGYVKDYPLAILHKTGKSIDVLYNAAVYKNDAGEIQGIFAAARDVTERKKMEKQLKDAERLAAIGATAGMVGHDIRNPLQAIMSDTYLLREELTIMPECKTKEDVLESIDSIEKNISYINKIVADLQDYARPLRPECIDVDLYELVTSVFTPINIPDDLEPSIDVDVHFRIKSDPTLLRRILTNLIINAIQAMPNGGKLTIHASRGKKTAVISVEDTGVGIPDDVKPKLFTPMMTTKSKGQGLGLAVVKRLVESMEGSITFESELGKGTKFIINLPLLLQRGT